jgi:hypothetical protein
MTPGSPEEQGVAGKRPPNLDDLRRRIYAPDATAEDGERYRAALAAAEGGPVSDLPVAGPRRSPKAPGIRLVAATLAVLVAAALAALLPRVAAGPTVPAFSPITIDATARAQLLRNLAEGGPPGLTTYLLTHRTFRSTALRQNPMEHWGIGPGAVSLTLSQPSTEPGTVAVVLVCDHAGAASWTAFSLRPEPGSDDPQGPLADRTGRLDAGVPAAATFSYPAGHPPLRLWIEVPKGVRWGAEVLFTG